VTGPGGLFLAFEGGDGAGKSTQVRLLAQALRALGREVTVTRQPGGTELGAAIRDLVLHGDHVSPRAEALLFAADKAHHVDQLIRPALDRGEVVLTDRYTDSSVAYQGAGRDLAGAEVGRLSRWATDGLQPHLTVLLDVPAEAGLARVDAPDRLESEPRDFHERVRERFLELARRGGSRYLVVDGTRPADEITETIKARLEPVLPLSATQLADLERLRAEQAERDRLAAEARRLEEARTRAEAEERAKAEAAAAEAALLLAEQEAAVLAEERRVREEAAAAERARLAALHDADAQRAREEHARLRAQHAEERRLHKEQTRAEREEAHRRRARGHGTSRDDPSPTREVSLVDELFGAGDDDSLFGSADDHTVQLPRVDQRRDDR